MILKVDFEAFVIHKGFLCANSKYFHNAFNGRFQEAGDREVSLDDVEPGTVVALMNWLYYGKILFDEDKEPDPEGNTQNSEVPRASSAQTTPLEA